MEVTNIWATLVVVIIFQPYFLQGLQIPQFLKKKYGSQYGQANELQPQTLSFLPPPASTFTKTKTKTKSPYGSAYNPHKSKIVFPTDNQYSPTKTKYGGGCSGQPPSPMNAGVRCSSYGGCRANCLPNYQFPNGQTQISFVCSNGMWRMEGGDFADVPSCQPVCLPSCQNNGICMAPNQCNCPENFSGPQCQFENKPCLNYPAMPVNSRRVCNSKQCTITCAKGHEFPDGSEIATMLCKNGNWVPSKNKWASVPDCRATCNPPCLNGGNCLSFNVCQCPQDYRGPQCQYSADTCTAKKLPTNAGYNCSGDADSFSCSLACPEGIHFEFQPESVYTCYYSIGIFEPTPIPKCKFPENAQIIAEPGMSQTFYFGNGSQFGHQQGLGPAYQLPMNIPNQLPDYITFPDDLYSQSNIAVVQPGYFGKHEHQLVTVELKLPKPGFCFHWGGTHYKTFDSQIFSFDSKCPHVLVRDSVDNTFSVVTQNHDDCYTNPIKCHTVTKIYLQGKEYILKRSPEGIPVFATSKKILPIPGQVPGIRVEMLAHQILVALDSVGAKLKWDGKQVVQIEVSESLWNRTEGLCGRIDGDPQNDVVTKEGQRPRNVATLASSWKVDDLEEFCDDSAVQEYVCQDTGVKESLPNKATLYCKKLLADNRFAPCHHVIDISLLLDACRWDYCNCKENDRTLCACETMNIYVQDCSRQGVTGLANWRDEDTCPMHCTGGKVYKSCGPAKGQPGCGNAVEISNDENEETCVEGCYCPEGTVVHEDKCITKDKCPCMLRGKKFNAGTSVPKDCNTCTCNEGQWVCTQVDCGARCSAVGDPHYVTFDGRQFDFMGQCSYYLVKNDNFTIEAENVACAGSISQAMNFPASVSSGLPSCTKTVTIRIDNQVIKLKQNHEVVVNGQDITKLPYSIAGVNIKSLSSIFLLAKLPNGIEIWWDGVTRVYVDVPAAFKGETKGLCGTFNNNQKDDFLTPEDDIEQAVIPFANKWKTNEKCNDIPEVVATHPCDKNIHKKPTAEKHCAKLKSKLFKECHFFVDPNQYYQDCLYDMCACEFKVSKCLCPIVSNYASECARKGIKVDWRGEVRECGVHCPGGQQYQVCGNSCTRTCFDIAVEPDCKIQCAEGCNCPQGQALDDNGECIPIGQCKCQYQGLEFPAGYQEVRPAPNGQELCTCMNAVWSCKLATPDDIKAFPRADDLRNRCDASKNMEFTTCEPVEPMTCKNMHAPDYFSASVCHSGCQCKEGYVLETKSKTCVKPIDCPCHHGGKSYKENATVQSDCNTCVCQNAKWKCSDRQCSTDCSAWGDSHYKTFDGKHYDYQGQCDYVFAKGSSGAQAFDVTTQNVPCGSLGTACSKSVTIRVASGDVTETLTLSKDKPIPKYKTYKNMILREKGLYVIVDVPEMGLVIHWDKGTRVYVKVDPRWKDKTKGLCGNYNGDDSDDFQTPSGGLAEVSANIFGDSWRLQSYCPEALEVTDTCSDRPDRKVWALKKCGIMKSPLFAPCHSEVPLEYYFDKCIFDTCACDQGGDCECLCTALAAYAQECNNRGVPIKWRSQELCPMQCDQRCSAYSPCISTCPEETCDNILVNKKLSKTCAEDICVEGCSPKPCPPGYIYTNSSLLDCVPRNVCKPVCMEVDGVTYYEGDMMEEDDCHSCYCSMQEKICKGQACTTPTPIELTTHQLEQLVSCKTGWTEWINQDKVSFSKGKQRNKKLEIEPLPTTLVLNNLKESTRCNVSQMVDIECRTVGSHKSAKDTGLNAECSLEKGLICKSSAKGKLCPDFEIRVFCQCEEPLTTGAPGCDVTMPSKEHPRDCHKFYECAPGPNGNDFVEKTCGPTMLYNPLTRICDWPEAVRAIKETCIEKEETRIELEAAVRKCPPGMKYDNCAIECDRLCLHYLYVVKEKGLCHAEGKCEAGCVSAEKKLECPTGMFWADDHTCVTLDECVCVSDEGVPLKPGKVVEEDNCKTCQCINNHYSCYASTCITKAEPELEEVVNSDISKSLSQHRNLKIQFGLATAPPLPASVTPPPLCDESRFINLIQGDQPLPDDAFNASSVLNDMFAPSNARLNSRVTQHSGGSWAPKYSNQYQYLQVDLGKQEPVYGVIVRGSPLYDEYVTSYNVMYSPDGDTFYYVMNLDNYPVVFRGSMDTTTPVKQVFASPIEARIIRINPQTWNNGISLRVEIIGCAEETSTAPATTPYFEHIYTKPQAKPQQCDDPMGLEDSTMSDQQIFTSSDLSAEHGKKHLKLNGDSSWQPITNSPTEFVMFDFLEPREITGVVTQGGDSGWVTAYTLHYSNDKTNWNPLVDDNRKEKIFLGNYDTNSPQVNNFDLPLSARYVKIVPTKWHDNIQVRVEMHGCFKPYPTIEEVSYTTPLPSICNDCPGVETSIMELEACRCSPDLWWDGDHCVNRTMCPCIVGHIPYSIGSIFEKDDCSQCMCKLGGVPYCTPKKCEPCKQGLRSTLTSTCACTCQPCPEDTILCPTSNICINSTLWCNGVQDCPDDEVGCTTTIEEITTTTTVAPTTTRKPVKKCPIIECKPGYKKVPKKVSKSLLYHSYLSPMISGQTNTKTRKVYSGLKTSPGSWNKGGSRRQNLKRPLPVVAGLAEEELVCPEFKCVSTKPRPKYINSKDECPPVICQANYIPVFDDQPSKKTRICPTYSCYPPPEPDAVCNVTGRTFNTFDNVEYKYDICNHVLARDLEADEWDISLKKNCTTSCSRDLIINHQEHLFVIHPDLSMEFDGYRYSVEQTKSIGEQNQAFVVSQLGNTLLFVSSKFGFWVIWNKMGDVKLGVVHKLIEKVDGLCGYFNEYPDDDKRKPDGSPARTTVEFGDSWALANDQPAICDAKTCPMDLQNKAWEMCNRVKEQSLSVCARVLDIDSFISRCLETTCSCLEHSLNNHTAEEECRCQSMQSFVVDCLSADSTIDISDWRMQQDCPVSCESPLVYHDCYQRRCEPTCTSISDPNVCPKINNVCFPGCYCPPGYVRKDDNCIKPSSCRDCECNVLPHLQYITYDENNFTISGNCVFVMSRDLLLDGEDKHKFQVLVTNHPCKKNQEKMCVGKVTILYEGHKIHVLMDDHRNKLKLIVDSERISDFDDISQWAAVRETATKHLKILLTALQVEVSVYFPSLGISVKAPSHKYGGRLEGLCGNCNGDPEDDFRKPNGDKLTDVNDMGLSWLYENLPGGQTREQCENKNEEECPPLPADNDPCLQLVDAKKFGQCLNVLDPSLFIDWCNKDTCGGHPELSCSSIEAYARDCASSGFCINWRNEFCPSKSCPPDQFYDPCGTNHPKTCDTIKINAKTKQKRSIPTEGCYCPEGKVFLNETCVVPKDCEVCDNEGHHPGDTWKKDKCTTCSCEGTSLKCETQHCAGSSTICERGYNAIKLPSNEEECCDKYACVPEPTAGPTCETPQQLLCGPNQNLKLNTKPNGCQTFICECKQRDECEPLDLTTDIPLEPGYVKDVDDAGCCPVVKQICKKELCPPPQDCPQFHSLKTDVAESRCCPLYSCEPPKDKCIFETVYTAATKGGERLLTKFEKQQILKGGNETWRDGPCRECKCILTSIGNYQPTCSQTDCPSIKTHSDYGDYELVLQPAFEQCCASVKRTGCKHNGKSYKVGEKWSIGSDHCTTMECIESPTGILKETRVQSCDKKCELGFVYEEPKVETQQCCGSCKPVACVVDGVLKEIGEEWTSMDHCINYLCNDINGTLQVQSVVVNCPEVPEDIARDFVIDTLTIEGHCCKEHIPVACKVGDTVYKIGESWASPDGDKCKTIKCVEKPDKKGILKQESVQTCKKDCAKGWKYHESNKTCCGSCVQVACVVDGHIKTSGETWTSEDNCTTFTCERLGDQFSVTSQLETCPALDDCPDEYVYVKGCCKFCNRTVSASQSLCSPEAIPLGKTVNMIKDAAFPQHGLCVNKEPIVNFTECVGGCHSSTQFNIASGFHESVCSCCQATKYTSIIVELTCSDGAKKKKKVAVPSRCGCEGCATNKSSFKKAPTKVGVKTTN